MDLNHLHLMVADLERSKAFYADLFGFKEKQRYGPDLLFIQNSSGFDLALTPTSNVERLPKGIHFGFSVPGRSQLDELFQTVKRLYPAHLKSERPQDHGDWGTFTCADPDGYTIEVYWDQNLQ